MMYQSTPQTSPDDFNQSIGGMKLGDSAYKMRTLLGQEERTETSKSLKINDYFYSDAIIVTNNEDRIVKIISVSDQLKTERGLGRGSTLDQVIKEYGLNCIMTIDGSATIYEYPFDSTSKPDKSAVIRFNVEDDVVSSISLRLIEGKERSDLLANVKPLELNEPPASAPSEPEPTQPAPSKSDQTQPNANTATEALNVLASFHRYITNRELRSAFNCLSLDFQSAMSYEGWAPGFDTTVSSSVSNVKVESETDNVVVLSYVLTAVDKINGREQTAQFNGTATMIKENGAWKIDEIINKAR